MRKVALVILVCFCLTTMMGAAAPTPFWKGYASSILGLEVNKKPSNTFEKPGTKPEINPTPRPAPLPDVPPSPAYKPTPKPEAKPQAKASDKLFLPYNSANLYKTPYIEGPQAKQQRQAVTITNDYYPKANTQAQPRYYVPQQQYYYYSTPQYFGDDCGCGPGGCN